MHSSDWSSFPHPPTYPPNHFSLLFINSAILYTFFFLLFIFSPLSPLSDFPLNRNTLYFLPLFLSSHFLRKLTSISFFLSLKSKKMYLFSFLSTVLYLDVPSTHPSNHLPLFFHFWTFSLHLLSLFLFIFLFFFPPVWLESFIFSQFISSLSLPL